MKSFSNNSRFLTMLFLKELLLEKFILMILTILRIFQMMRILVKMV